MYKVLRKYNFIFIYFFIFHILNSKVSLEKKYLKWSIFTAGLILSYFIIGRGYKKFNFNISKNILNRFKYFFYKKNNGSNSDNNNNLSYFLTEDKNKNKSSNNNINEKNDSSNIEKFAINNNETNFIQNQNSIINNIIQENNNISFIKEKFKQVLIDPNFINPIENGRGKYDLQFESLNTEEKISFDVYFGPPGTGKSLIPEKYCFDNKKERLLIKIVPKDFINYGKDLFYKCFYAFETLKKKELVILFDEADSFLCGDLPYVNLFFSKIFSFLKKVEDFKKIKFLFTTNLPGSIDKRIKNISTLFKFNDLAAANEEKKIEDIMKTIIKNKFYKYFKVFESKDEIKYKIEINKNLTINSSILINGKSIRTFYKDNPQEMTLLEQICSGGSNTISFAQIETFLLNSIYTFFFSEGQVNMYNIYKMIRFGGPKFDSNFEKIAPKNLLSDLNIENIHLNEYSDKKKNDDISIDKFLFKDKDENNNNNYYNINNYDIFKNLFDSLNEKDEGLKNKKLEFFKKPILLCDIENKGISILKEFISKLNENIGDKYRLYNITKKDILNNLEKGYENWFINLLNKIKSSSGKKIVYIQDLEEFLHSRDKNYLPASRKYFDKSKIFINVLLPYLDDLIQDENFILFFSVKKKRIIDLYSNFQSAISSIKKEDFYLNLFNPDLEFFSEFFLKKIEKYQLIENYKFNKNYKIDLNKSFVIIKDDKINLYFNYEENVMKIIENLKKEYFGSNDLFGSFSYTNYFKFFKESLDIDDFISNNYSIFLREFKNETQDKIEILLQEILLKELCLKNNKKLIEIILDKNLNLLISLLQRGSNKKLMAGLLKEMRDKVESLIIPKLNYNYLDVQLGFILKKCKVKEILIELDKSLMENSDIKEKDKNFNYYQSDVEKQECLDIYQFNQKKEKVFEDNNIEILLYKIYKNDNNNNFIGNFLIKNFEKKDLDLKYFFEIFIEEILYKLILKTTEGKEFLIELIKGQNYDNKKNFLDKKNITDIFLEMKKISFIFFSRDIFDKCYEYNVGNSLDSALFRAERFGLKVQI